MTASTSPSSTASIIKGSRGAHQGRRLQPLSEEFLMRSPAQLPAHCWCLRDCVPELFRTPGARDD